MLRWMTQLGFLKILMICADLRWIWKKKNKFYNRGYLGQSQTTPSFIHYSEVSDSRGGGEMSTKINKQVRSEESIYQVLLPSYHQAGHQPTNV